MTQLQAVKNEIERYIKHYEKLECDDFKNGEIYMCQELLFYIESLEKKEPQGLDEAALKYQIETYGPRVMGGANVLSDEEYMQWNKNKDFIAGAKWMAEQKKS